MQETVEPQNEENIEILPDKSEIQNENKKNGVAPKRIVDTDSEKKVDDKAKIIEESKKILHEGLGKVKTGINGLDELVDGGFERDSVILIVGSAGTGKTLFSMQFLYEGATKYDEPGLFISFEEEEQSLYKHAMQFGWDFKKLERENKFKILCFKPHQVTKILEEGGGQIRDTLKEIKAKRIVIDSITAYGLLFSDEYKRREKMLEFFTLMRKWQVTALVIVEDSPQEVEREEGSIGFISDAIISMYYQHDEEKGLRIHALEIVKMRGTKHTNKLCAINFEENGITVYPDVEVF